MSTQSIFGLQVSTQMLAWIWQAIVVLLVIQFVTKRAVPDYRRYYNNEFADHANRWFRTRHRSWFIALLAGGLLLQVANVIFHWDFYFKDRANALSKIEEFVPLVLLQGAIHLVVVILLFTWIAKFFESGRRGFFRDLQAAPVLPTDVSMPLLWRILVLTFVFDFARSLIGFMSPRLLLEPIRFLHLSAISFVASLAGSVLAVGVVFYCGIKGYGTGRTVFTVAFIYVGLLLLGVLVSILVIFRQRQQQVDEDLLVELWIAVPEVLLAYLFYWGFRREKRFLGIKENA